MTLSRGGHLRALENAGVYVMIHNGSKITVMKVQPSQFMVKGHHSMRNCVKGRLRIVDESLSLYLSPK